MGLKKILVFIPIALSVGASHMQALTLVSPAIISFQTETANQEVLAEREMSLANRYAVPSVNEVFADNILLNLSYLSNRVPNPQAVDWDEVRKPQSHKIVLKPGEVFAYHDSVLPEFADKTTVTTNAHFNAAQGFRSSGYLYGDGVCHLASLLNWTAKDAGLRVVSPVNHDFARIPDIAREYGTAIYYVPGEPGTSQQQNLYIENTFDKTVTFVIDSQKDSVKVRVEKEK